MGRASQYNKGVSWRNKDVSWQPYCIFKRYKDIFEGAYRSRVCPLEPFKYFDYSGVEEQIELALPDSSAPFVLPSVSRLERAVLLCGFAAKITS